MYVTYLIECIVIVGLFYFLMHISFKIGRRMDEVTMENFDQKREGEIEADNDKTKRVLICNSCGTQLTTNSFKAFHEAYVTELKKHKYYTNISMKYKGNMAVYGEIG